MGWKGLGLQIPHKGERLGEQCGLTPLTDDPLPLDDSGREKGQKVFLGKSP